MGFAGPGAAHLAGEAIAIQSQCPHARGHETLRSDSRREAREQVAARAEVAPVAMGEDVHAELVAEFAHAPRPLADASNLPQLVGRNHRADVLLEEPPQLVARGARSLRRQLAASIGKRSCRWVVIDLTARAGGCFASAALSAFAIELPTAFATGGGNALPTCR